MIKKIAKAEKKKAEKVTEKVAEEIEVEEEEAKEETEEKGREIVTPGEVIISGKDYLPGDGTEREGEEITATKFGLSQIDGRIVKVIPLSGVYLPRRGNIVIGKIIYITFNGWLLDINSPYDAFLPVAECRGYINKSDLASHFDFGDMLVANVKSVKLRGVDLTMKERDAHKLKEGMIIEINPSKVPRVIGKQGSMINLIKNETDSDIIVGQNGIVWINAANIEKELLAKKAIMLVAEKSRIGGLTEKTKEFLEKEKTKRIK